MRWAVVALVLCGCGGGSPSTSFIGYWRGTTAVAVDDVAPFEGPGNLTIVGGYHFLDLRLVCPRGDGRIIIVADDGPHARWVGSLECAPVTWLGCSETIPTLTHVDAFEPDDGSLTVRFSGTASGCGTVRPFVSTFTGLVR